MTERELERQARRRLAVLRHVEEVSFKCGGHLPLLRDQPGVRRRCIDRSLDRAKIGRGPGARR